MKRIIFVLLYPSAAIARDHDPLAGVAMITILAIVGVVWFVGVMIFKAVFSKKPSDNSGSPPDNQDAIPEDSSRLAHSKSQSTTQHSDDEAIYAAALHEKDRIQQEHHSAHLAAVEAAQRKLIAFQYVIDNLSSCGYEAKRTTNGWTIREPLGGRVKLKSDQALLDYAQGRITIPAELSSKQATGNQLTSMQTDTRSYPEALATEDPRQRVQPGPFDPAVLGTKWLKFWNYFAGYRRR